MSTKNHSVVKNENKKEILTTERKEICGGGKLYNMKFANKIRELENYNNEKERRKKWVKTQFP